MKITKVSSAENYLELPDGRMLCYAEYGDPNGFPIFVLHGNPSSRLSWGVYPGSPFLSNVRLIAPDRPGYGRTDYVEGVTTLENWPNDLAALADSLGIDKFSVFGPSGGGPFALACAWKIPERLTSVGIFAGVGPLNEETQVGMMPMVTFLWEKAPKVPSFFKLQMRFFAWLVKVKPELYLKMILTEFSENDKEHFNRLNLGKANNDDRQEAYRQKGIGTWYDVMIPSNWPIPLKEIKTKVFIWQGELDESVSPAMARYMDEHIPDSELDIIENNGHFWLLEHCAEMLEKLVAYQG